MAEEIGVAYLSVKPKVDGSFDNEIKSAGKSAGGGFGGAFGVAAGNLISGAIEKVAGSITDTLSNAFNNYANFEQLKGGVEKIFDQANVSGIMADAQNAYSELNMSANQYLESINKVGAAFAQTMGDQKGYDTARTGMKAISDYASGTGRNLDELNEKYAMITRATSSYQSIADQFSGILPATSADFLAQAQAAGLLSSEYSKLTDVPVAEYQEAVSKMLEKGVADMGLADNTLHESTQTISGSLAMLKSSWDNFLTGIFDKNADMGTLGQNLIDSVGAVLANVGPAIMGAVGRVVMGLPGAIINALNAIPQMLAPAITEVFGEELGGQINEALGGAFGGFADMLQGLFTTVIELFSQIYATVQPVLALIAEAVLTCMPIIQDAIQIVMTFLEGSVIPMVTRVFETVAPAIQTIADGISEKMPMIQDIMFDVMAVIEGLIERVWPHIEDIVMTVMNGVVAIIDKAWPVISKVIDVAMNVISNLIETAWPIIYGIIETVMGAIETVVRTVWPVIQGIVETAVGAISGAIEGIGYVVGIVQGIFDGVRSAIEDPIGTAQGFIEDFADTISNILGNLDLSLPDIALPHFYIWGGEFPFGIAGEGSPPEFDIEWYAKGGIVDGAQLIGAGERGAELIWPSYGTYFDMYAKGIAEHMPASGGVDIHDCTFNVRDDSDIRKVAQELNTLIIRQQAGAYLWD